MLVHQYTTEQAFLDDYIRLKAIFDVPDEDLPFVAMYELTDYNWYIQHNDVIAPYMPPPIDMFNYVNKSSSLK